MQTEKAIRRTAPRHSPQFRDPGREQVLAYLIATTPAWRDIAKRPPPPPKVRKTPEERRLAKNQRQKLYDYRRSLREPLPPRTVKLKLFRPRKPRTIRLAVIQPRRVSLPLYRPGRPDLPERPFDGFPLKAHPSGQWKCRSGKRDAYFGRWFDAENGARSGTLAEVDPTGRMWRAALAKYEPHVATTKEAGT